MAISLMASSTSILTVVLYALFINNAIAANFPRSVRETLIGLEPIHHNYLQSSDGYHIKLELPSGLNPLHNNFIQSDNGYDIKREVPTGSNPLHNKLVPPGSNPARNNFIQSSNGYDIKREVPPTPPLESQLGF